MPKPTRKPTPKRTKTRSRSNVAPAGTLKASWRKLSGIQLTAVVALVVGLGVFVVWSVFAGTIINNEVESWGSSGGTVAIKTDPSAANGSYLEFQAPSTGGTAGLPSGVTLQEPDGGANYYAKWTNGLPTDPSFFPIGLFNGFNLAVLAPGHKAAGINTYVDLYNGALSGNPSEMSVAKSLGMYAFVGGDLAGDTTFKNQWGNTAIGYVYQDEAEGNPCTKINSDIVGPACKDNGEKIFTSSFIDMTNIIRKADPSRMVYNGFTNGFACNWYVNGDVLNLAKGSDIIGYDNYPRINTRFDYNGCFESGKNWGHYTSTMNARKNANYTVPIWPVLETTSMDASMNTLGIRPTQADIKIIPWQNIIAGARGIVWFNNNFDTRFGEATNDVINDLPGPRQAVTQVNQQITRLARVINAPTANGYASSTGAVNYLSKYLNGDGFYIFAATKSDNNQNVTFSVKTGSTVTVVDENRTLPISNGQFSDTFAGGTGYHIYKIN